MRVYIRKPLISDVKEYVDKNRASMETHRPWVFPATTPAGFRSYCEYMKLPRYEGFFICRKEDDAIVGVVNLSEIIRGALNGAFVGYWLYRGYEGRGYMTEGFRRGVWRLEPASTGSEYPAGEYGVGCFGESLRTAQRRVLSQVFEDRGRVAGS